MSYGDTQLAMIDQSHARSVARGSASLKRIGRAGRQAIVRNPLASTAAIGVASMAALTAARASRRAPRVVSRLSTGALGLLRLEGVLTSLRALIGGSSQRERSSSSSEKAPAA